MSYNYFGKKILILGLGLTGISCINFFLKKGIQPRVIDESNKPIFLNKIPKNIEYKLGNLKENWILESDLIIISPGISSFKPILMKARSLGIDIISDIELFSRETKCPIISITGTNGKSTVATMVKKIAEKSGYKVLLGGNIGFPVLEMLNKKASLYVLELSSFQLETTFNLKSKIAVVLNITEDHLDRYPEGFEQYKKTKLSIYNKAKICLIKLKKGEKKPFNTKSKKYISFGTCNNNDYYINYEKEKAILFHKNKKIVDTSNILLNGHHNYENILTSLAISDQMKFDQKVSINVLKKFLGLPHRFQTVHINNNISWINDSKSTNVDSTKAALKNLKIKGTIWLLLGGDGKSSNFNILKKYFEKIKIKIYCFGKDGLNLSKLCKKKSIYTKTLKQAIILISKKIQPGDVVLLSPGCSSKDQFSNFEERGNLFIKLSKEIN
ncbi:UDP-N-acetylmuramoyl-L-alanine--D-glutamate ligase [Buchnera aphidicola]|jgi:UDP-N-acetylmuramoylalanine--D-glutamate ligase|uniref:UDP-N-acetylmuramoylalanine--D-glutamate ligase n=1 Tax=Buchnera aphidicola subsp. Schizaphis graminum (strain Sg) TaxID=198804 RepID=MURD_BUCAP|nr:UDP-N-acetylmuramoyl-L-alanine--D-glutamate ligase [Buchnera aphidicola]Q8K9T2.1 RecName: Full=UDP-N-acetylmuramoylalanine--D-glutamate ligase; AltName: Full=D-glutamic acid-adding enzyme; AltName: Full=UDP-N-acetylmuramoyl-L-alanyl-D-glutamate synthetase [Buchnera aphidicola str. Sg (Schizaphis graminum)]AAM67775.1 UDP-N-acetylmuramoylalanine--D-glutamate ligase [Buchnera aphidicola str. Sg (Schizaphis graminum)]AWI49728.1 UDP-N-acetylmuramoyl-L-alanine--D-glutamate ligase [Buchnera aphidico